ncbi:MAG: hypothetical protein HY049_15195 [Acidobacteria bacterium]|nr:hypothetical protein [Acidobacteriota bacterium]
MRWTHAAAAWALASALTAGTSGPEVDSETVARAFERGAACAAARHAGDGFRDRYLEYVYPGEDVPRPPGSSKLTYRAIDADTVLVLLARAGQLSEPLASMAGRADEALRGALPLWRGRGFTNVSRDPHASGVALDTFCFVSWLYRDEEGAREVAAAMDDGGWLPEHLYEGEERFRRSADEAWCVRLLQATGIEGTAARKPFDRLVAEFKRDAAAAPADRGTFYEGYHLGMLVALGAAGGPPDAALAGDIVGALRAWAAAHHPTGPAPPEDLFEWANLPTAEALRAGGGEALGDEAARVLLASQGSDGCWSPSAKDHAAPGSTFLTLRALLALAPYRRAGSTEPSPRAEARAEPGTVGVPAP